MLIGAVGVAAAKSGTTWLHECLSEHPEILMPKVKELDFFSHNYAKGTDFYHEQFSSKPNAKLVAEFSPSYGPHQEAPSRIYQYNPQMKIIWMLREPIDRAYSHYCMACRSQQRILPIQEILDLNSDFIKYGEYSRLIENYLKYFPIQQNLFLDYNDISNPLKAQELLQKVYSFLGVNSLYQCSLTDQKMNTRKSLSRFPKLFNFAKTTLLNASAKSSFIEYLVQNLRRSSLMGYVHKINSAPSEFEALSEELKYKLEKHYEPFNQRLVMITGQSWWI